jgi:hypothetical protein
MEPENLVYPERGQHAGTSGSDVRASYAAVVNSVSHHLYATRISFTKKISLSTTSIRHNRNGGRTMSIQKIRSIRPAAVLVVGLALLSGLIPACSSDVEASTFQREAVDEATSNPFMEGVNTAPASQAAPTNPPDPTTTTTSPKGNLAPATVPTNSSETFPGDTPGLYGGSQNKAVCDATKMAAFLDTNPEKAKAWAKVLGIETKNIAEYISLLTPVTLRSDTAVTNHGFSNGKATTVPAVLQAGTAVFVNEFGVPVVKCSCGNPLTAPSSRKNAKYTGSSWSGFSADSVTAVRKSPDRMNDLVLVDPTTNTAFTRPTGTDGDADVGYVPPPADPSSGVEDPSTPSTSTTSSTTTPTATSTTTSTAPAGTTVEFEAVMTSVGACADTPASNTRVQVVDGRTIVFPDLGSATGQLQPDGSFDFTEVRPLPGGTSGTATYRFSGRVVSGMLTLNVTFTVESPATATFTCEVRGTAGTDTPPATTTSTTSLPAVSNELGGADITGVTEQTWYFDALSYRTSLTCNDLRISVVEGGDSQRIRVRDSISEGRTITFLGRPSRTLDVAADGSFSGVLIAAGIGDPDQPQVTVSGGPVPAIGQEAGEFNYEQTLTVAEAPPGAFSRDCGIAYAARPRS